MRVTWKAVTAGLALALVSTTSFAIPVSMPSCSSTTNWGSLGPPGSEAFGKSFGSAGTYNDCYTFSLSASADSVGGTAERDAWLNALDIDVSKVSLYLNSTIIGNDQSPDNFAFAGLSAGGLYTLIVSSVVTADWGIPYAGVGYTGNISTYKSRATSVPEPATLTLLGLGLVAAAAVRRRKRSDG